MTNADNTLYHFSDEEDGEDAILARAFERWEQIGGGAASDPLFHFKMQPTGRRRCWRNVLERVQFNAQLRQLGDPVAGDNIGLTLTEALHDTIENELQREQRPAHHFVNLAITAHGLTHAYQTANFKAWVSGAATTSARIASSSSGDRGSLWIRGAKTTLTRVEPSISIAGDD